MALKKGYAAQNCSLARTLELVGERWTMLVIRDAFYGVRRYSDFLAHLDIPRAVLSTRLRTLTESGVLARQRYETSPPRDEYVLTDKGLALWSALFALLMWGQAHASTGAALRLFVHIACGSPLTPGGGCEICAITAVPPTDVEIHPGPGAATSARRDPVSLALTRPHRLLDPVETST